jgi:hypothetical protein
MHGCGTYKMECSYFRLFRLEVHYLDFKLSVKEAVFSLSNIHDIGYFRLHRHDS